MTIVLRFVEPPIAWKTPFSISIIHCNLLELVLGMVKITVARNHPAPTPVPSCPILSFFIFPTSFAFILKTSVLPFSKYSLLVGKTCLKIHKYLKNLHLRTRLPVSPFSPNSTAYTFASVPAFLTSKRFKKICRKSTSSNNFKCVFDGFLYFDY